MLNIHTTYEFSRNSDGETISLTGTVGAYKGEIPTKKIFVRTTPDQDTDFTEIEVLDYESVTPKETSVFIWNIPTDLRTSATPVDKSGSTPERNGEFEDKLKQIKEQLDDDTEYTNTVSSLMNKYSEEDDIEFIIE
tara:strand:+ start:84 stop:491 length:408 start_codon:yes stop_codon:yes gene_type:complete